MTAMAQRVLDDAPPRFSVCGFSMGGRVAMQILRLAPERQRTDAELLQMGMLGLDDARIADLKAVEQWLNVNQSMLHNTIQGLEIQRGTLAAIRAFSEQAGMPSPMASMAKAASPAPKASPFSTDGWPMKPPAARTDPEAGTKPAQQERTQDKPQAKAQAAEAGQTLPTMSSSTAASGLPSSRPSGPGPTPKWGSSRPNCMPIAWRRSSACAR
jgi:pimeloyl-ACP methyl ester carboxylesterase